MNGVQLYTLKILHLDMSKQDSHFFSPPLDHSRQYLRQQQLLVGDVVDTHLLLVIYFIGQLPPFGVILFSSRLFH